MDLTKVVSMMKFVGVIVPEVITLMKVVETAVPQSGQGQTKLAIVQNAVEESYKQVEGNLPAFGVVWKVLSGIISAFVSIFNKNGTFTTSPTAPAPSTITATTAQ
jgi:hypothetical protein